MSRMRLDQSLAAAALICGLATGARADQWGAATWDTPAAGQLEERLRPWLANQPLTDQQRAEIDALWAHVAGQSGGPVFDAVLETIAMAEPAAAPLIDACRNGDSLLALEAFSLLDDEKLPGVVRDNLRLLVGRSFALSQLYDEALDQLARTDITQVADPAALLFYLAVTHFRLRHKDEGLVTLEKLLEREDQIPDRFATVARLMEANLKDLHEDSLDEIALIMDSIRVRLGHGHAGKRVRREERDVVDKLERMIEELEKQLEQRNQASSGGMPQGIQSNNPAADSALPQGRGQGDVDRKRLGDATEWGNLPAKERQETLQHIGKDFPSHYRDVIEEYFRRLARDNSETPQD